MSNSGRSKAIARGKCRAKGAANVGDIIESRGSLDGGLICAVGCLQISPISSRGASKKCGLTSTDSGLQLDLEIALSGVSAKVQPHELPSVAEDALKLGNVIDVILEYLPNKCRAFYV
jgi:hypothetical protein